MVAALIVLTGLAPTAAPTVSSRVPARISIITAREIDTWELRLLPDALGAQAGVSVAEASVAGQTASAWEYYLSGGYEREDGWRQATGARNYNGFLNLGHSRAERGVSLQAYAIRSRAETAGSLPESMFDTAPQINFTPGDFDDLDAQQLALSGYTPVGSGHASLTAYFRRSGGERFNVNQAPDPNVRGLTTNYTAGGTNETTPMDSYFVANARLGYTRAGWSVSGVVTNLFDSKRATFGTFNENRQTGSSSGFLRL